MNIDKRYCQNRASKRKKQSGIGNWDVVNVDLSSSAIEEERQFKLSRFVNDVNKFVQEKEQRTDKIRSKKERHSKKETVVALQKPVKAVTIPSKPMAKMGLFRNGVQTKFYTRGLMGKEMTARLDEDLHQIIALATNNKENECHCSHQRSKPVVFKPTASTSFSVDREPLHTLTSRTPIRAEKWTGEGLQTTPESVNESSRLAQMDQELYLDFTRIITTRAVETMTSLFSGINYFSEKKKELVETYLRAERENIQESAGLSETQKSSVATSPLRSPISPSSSSLHNLDPSRPEGIKLPFLVNFNPEPSKSFRQILEEMSGSRSSCQNILPLSSNPQERLPLSRHHHMRRYRSPPSQALSSEDQFDQISQAPPCLISPAVHHTSVSKYEPNRCQRSLSQFSSLLPPIEKESPEFQYYPKFVF